MEYFRNIPSILRCYVGSQFVESMQVSVVRLCCIYKNKHKHKIEQKSSFNNYKNMLKYSL